MSSAIVHSTAATAPITFRTGPRPGECYIELEDGSSQVYRVANLARALAAVTETEEGPA